MKRTFSTEPVTPEQIASWKADFKNVFAIDVPGTDEDEAPAITGYFRKPSIAEIGIATQGNEKNPLNSSLMLYNTCLLGGHPDFDTDEEVKRAAISQFKDILKTRTASIKKL